MDPTQFLSSNYDQFRAAWKDINWVSQRLIRRFHYFWSALFKNVSWRRRLTFLFSYYLHVCYTGNITCYILPLKVKFYTTMTTLSIKRKIEIRAKSQCGCIVKILKGTITSERVVLFQYGLLYCASLTLTFKTRYISKQFVLEWELSISNVKINGQTQSFPNRIQDGGC